MILQHGPPIPVRLGAPRWAAKKSLSAGILLSVDATVLFPAVYVCRVPKLLDVCLVETQSINRCFLPVIFFALSSAVANWMAFSWMAFWLFSFKGKAHDGQRKSAVPASFPFAADLNFSGVQLHSVAVTVHGPLPNLAKSRKKNR